MSVITQSHGGSLRDRDSTRSRNGRARAAPPAGGDVAVDEAADFGYLFAPSGVPEDYLPDTALDDLDELGDLMVPDADPANPNVTPDSTLPPVLTYWGQFLDHELTARTDRESEISSIETGAPIRSAEQIESSLKNARTPRFDLDSVYGGLPVGTTLAREAATVIAGMRHPNHPNKMRVGTAHTEGPLPDDLDPNRDLPRFSQVQTSVREAYIDIARTQMSPEDVAALIAGLPGRAIIGDMRNDENLIIAQFHVSFLRFHNRAIDYLAANDTGWIADFHAAQALTRLHYQWLIVDGYLRSVCSESVVDDVLANRAQAFFDFRTAYRDRAGAATLGNALPLEFSVAAYRFAHTMVRDAYDYNKNFGRTADTPIIDRAPFDELFRFTGKGGFRGFPRVPENWIIDWSRFVTVDNNSSDGLPARAARAIDTRLAPPLGDMLNEAIDEMDANVRALFRQLARRNLRRGFSLRLPTGQALHAHLKSIGAVSSNPIANVGNLLGANPALKSFVENSSSRLSERTPLWFYCLAEAEAAGGNHLGEMGSWIVASTFVATLLDDPTSALSTGFTPAASPLKMVDDSPIDSIEKWMKFAHVLQ